MTNRTERRAQDRRSEESRRAALALSLQVTQFTACDLAFRMTGCFPKQNRRTGSPTPGLSKCLSVMAKQGYLVVISAPKRGQRIYAAAKDGEPIAVRAAAVPPPRAEDEPFIRPLTPQELRQGKARPARAVRVNLEEPLWPEDRAQ